MIKEFFEEHKLTIFEILFIFIFVILNSVIFCGHYRTLFVDRGRELLIPWGVLNGDVIYQSILTIYSPLSYLINAVGMFFLGKNISTLYILGTLNCCIFLSVFYFLCHEFLNRMISWLLVFTVVYGCVCYDGIINYLFGHSFGMTYGLTAYLICLFCSIKFLKIKNISLLYIAAFFGGVALSLKMDFFPVIFIPFIPIINEKTNLKDIIKILGFLLLAPVLTFGFLFLQGLSFNELMSSLKFISDFTNTESMMNFYKEVGTIPDFDLVKIFRYILFFGEFLISCLLVYAGLFFTQKQKKLYPLILSALISLLFLVFISEPYYHFVFFPYILFIFFIFNYKTIINEEKLYILIFALFGLLIRVWADLRMNFYGIYTLPFVYLVFSTLICYFYREHKFFSKIKIEYFIAIFLFLHMSYYFLSDVKARTINNFPIKTEYGTIYLSKESQKDTKSLIEYIQNNTTENDKILVLPEGQMINFLCGRKSDLNLHMLDRLYYEALGEEKSLNLLKDTDSDYIVLVKGYGLGDFGKPYLYSEENSVTKHLNDSYQTVEKFGNENNFIEIKKKKHI